jgi:HSP20 family protein
MGPVESHQLDARHQSDWFGRSSAGTGAFPPINIFQQGDDFVAIVELPGVDKVDLEIEAKESTIRISGKKEIGFGTSASVHRRERASGGFDRTFSLPSRSMRKQSAPTITTAF